MKYEPGDEVIFGNARYEQRCVVVEGKSPQPTYTLAPVNGSSKMYRIEEDQLTLFKKKPAPCGHIRVRVVKKFDALHVFDWNELNDFCPLCGERLTPPPA